MTSRSSLVASLAGVAVSMVFALCASCSSSSSGGSVGSSGSSGSGATSGTGGAGTGGAATGGAATGGAVGSGGAIGHGGAGAACRSNSDCGNQAFLYCAPAGAAVGCGTCPSPSMCTGDADCNPDGGNLICVGACNGACPTKICVGGCVDDSTCAEGTHCDSTHRCATLSCTSDGQCPENFRCSNSLCARRTCQSDGDCPAYCVTGQCYSELGQCLQPQA